MFRTGNFWTASESEMRIEYKSTVLKQLKKIPHAEIAKIVKKIEFLPENPMIGKPLKGELEGLRSVRAWPYRIVYEIRGEKIIIISVAHRQSVY